MRISNSLCVKNIEMTPLRQRCTFSAFKQFIGPHQPRPLCRYWQNTFFILCLLLIEKCNQICLLVQQTVFTLSQRFDVLQLARLCCISLSKKIVPASRVLPTLTCILSNTSSFIAPTTAFLRRRSLSSNQIWYYSDAV